MMFANLSEALAQQRGGGLSTIATDLFFSIGHGSTCMRSLSSRLLHHRFQHFGEHAGDGAGAALMPDQQ